MSLLIPDDAAQLARQRDRMLADAQDVMVEATSEAVQQLLRQMRRAVRQQASLTASSPQLPRMTSDFLTLGQVNGWWSEAVDEHVIARVLALWQAGRSSATDAELTVRSLDAAGDYVAVVRDRLSRTATPTIPDQAFDTVRTALVDELSRGSSVREITDRLGAELQWQGQDVGFWQGRRADADRQIAAILDQAGPQFVTGPDGRRIENPARRDLRLNDPTVRQLQRESTEAGNRVARDRSTWQTRAEAIARTETTGAFNAGAQQAYAEEGAEVKLWLCAPDARTRDAHLAANGTCVYVTEEFEVDGEGLMFPGDPSGSAANVINCRCTTIGGKSCEELTGIAMPAIVEVDHERALREDAQREPVTVAEAAPPAQAMTVDADVPTDAAAAAAAGGYVRVTDPVLGEVETLDLSDANFDDPRTVRPDDEFLRQRLEVTKRSEELLEHYSKPELFAEAKATTVAQAQEAADQAGVLVQEQDLLVDQFKAQNLRLANLDEDDPRALAIRTYQDSHYHSVNGSLRGTKDYDGTDLKLDNALGLGRKETNREVIGQLDAAFDALPTLPQATTTYRTVSGDYADQLRTAPIGTQLRDAGYTSTTIAPIKGSTGEGYATVRVVVPEGSPAVYMNAQGSRSLFWGEEELLLPRGAVMEVVGHRAGYIDVKIVGYARDVLP